MCGFSASLCCIHSILWLNNKCFFFVQVVFARSVREAPATQDTWVAVLNAANETFISLRQALLNLNDVKSDQELINKVQNQVKTFGNDVQTNLGKLADEVSVNRTFIHFVQSLNHLWPYMVD